MTTKQLQKTWDALGREDPLWAVMSHREMKGNRWKLEDFLHTGEREIADALHHAESLHPGLRRGHALDFGCGVGRLSQALGDHFEAVDGVDIAPSMLARARDLNRHAERCREAPRLPCSALAVG